MALEIEVPVGLDLRQFEADINTAQGDIKGLAQKLTEIEKSITGESKKVKIEFIGDDKLSPVFKAVEDGFEGLDDASRGYAKQLLQASRTERGSVVQLRNLYAAKKQDINLTRDQSAANAKAADELLDAANAIRLAANASNANIDILRLEATVLKDLSQQAGLTSRARQELGRQIAENAQKQLELNGVEANSITGKRTQIRLLQEELEKLDQNSVKYALLKKQIDSLNKSVNNGKNVFKSFFNVLAKLSTVQAGFTAINAAIQSFNGFINQFINQTKQLQAFELALRNVGLTQDEVNTTLATATTTANRLGAPLQQVEKSYKRMVPALRAVGATTSETDAFLEAITARSQTLGLSTEQSGRFLEAFAQVLSKGKLQAEELNQQISELDGAFRTQLADALNVTTSELEELIEKGEITSDVFVKAVSEMENGVAALTNRVATNNLTVQQLQNIIKNLEVKNLRTIAAALEPGIKAFLDIGRIFQEFVAFVTTTQFGKFLVDSFNGVLIAARNLFRALTEIAKVIITVLEPVFALYNALNDLLKPFGGLIGIVVTIAVPLAAMIAALGAIRTASVAASIALAFYSKTTIGAGLATNAFANAARKFQAGQFIRGIRLMITGLRSLSANLVGPAVTSLKVFQNQARVTSLAASKSFKKLAVDGIGSIVKGLKNIRAPKINTKQITTSINGAAAATAGYTGKFGKFVHATRNYVKAGTVASSTTTALAASSAGAAKSFGLAALAAGGLKLALVGVVAGIGVGFIKTFTDAKAIQNELTNSTKELAETYKDAGSDIKNGLNPVAKFFKDIRRIVGDFIEAYRRLFGGGQRDVNAVIKANRQYIGTLGNIDEELRKVGVSTANLQSVRKLDGKDIEQAKKLAKDRAKLSQLEIDAIDKIIKKKTEERTLTPELRAELEKQKALREIDLETSKELIAAIDERKDAIIEEGDALQAAAISYQEYQAAKEAALKNIETKALNAQIGIEEEITDTQEKRYKKQAALAGVAANKNKELQAQLRKQLADERRLAATAGKDRDKYRAEAAKTEKAIADARLEAAKQEQAFADQLLDNFEELFNKATRYAQIWQEIGRTVSQAQYRIADAASGSLSGFSQLVDAVYDREINAVGKNDAARKALLQDQLKIQAIIIRLETDLQRAKLITANKIAEVEIKTVQERLKGEALIAAARGDNKSAALLFGQVVAQEKVLQARRKILQIDLRSLDIQKRIRDEQLNQKAISAGIDPRTIGTSITSLKDIGTIAVDVIKDIKGITQTFENPSFLKLFKQGLEQQKRSIAEAGDGVRKQVAVYNQIAGFSAKVANSWGRINAAVRASANSLNRIQAIVSVGGARWTGGPVAGGQTYRVNDAGLGREAFVNQFGRVSMLPASQNINWTAPSSGTILPAHVVRAMKKNSDINNKISVNSNQSAPVVSVSAGRAASIDSGNLVKQVSSAMTGSNTNQRIVNNVTIQSQKPVEDASKIMTEAAMIRLRRSRRF